ncbi:TRAP transporter large permease [Variovorax sp. VNK109]|uniref:TRAP transporter large permease n=1 Tax=Variovorax sp. VNK109 TaxID=3400919 RepID=UPI003C0A33DF
MFESLLGLAVIMALSMLRIPIALAMGLVGFVGLGLMRNWQSAGASVSTVFFESGFQYTLSVMPLFVLMGNFVTNAGMSRELYRAAHALVGHLRGGLAMATVLACAGFGAICGSSIATSATMTRVAYQPMKQYGYSDATASASIAAGGTLGILIPPSVIMILYGIMTDTSIGALFAAGVLPGLLATGLFLLSVQWLRWRRPDEMQAGEPMDWKARAGALVDVWLVLLLFIVVMGGIYGGLFTATEGAGIGAFGGFVCALQRRRLTWKMLFHILKESARTTAMMFAVMIGAMIFANFVTYTTLGSDLINFVKQFSIHPLLVVVAICAIYILLGTVMEELSMILLTVPVFFPLVTSLGFDGVWFGVLVVVVMMVGLISPPVGMNLFVVRNLVPSVQLRDLFAGVMPYLVAQIVLLALLITFPQIALVLPRWLGL